MSRTKTLRSLLLAGGLAGILLGQGCSRGGRPVRLATYLTANRLTCDTDSGLVAGAAGALLQTTRWYRKFQINRRYDASQVNFYIIDGQSSAIQNEAALEDVVGNCAFLGENVVVIDAHFIRDFRARHRFYPASAFVSPSEDRRSLVYWMVGHELGHLLSGHLSGHFGPRSLDSFVRNSALRNREELQADSCFVRALVGAPALLHAEEELMIDVLNAEVRDKAGPVRDYGVGIIYDYSSETLVQYLDQPTHPEYVIRLARMLELSSRLSNDTGVLLMVGGFIRHLQRAGQAPAVQKETPKS